MDNQTLIFQQTVRIIKMSFISCECVIALLINITFIAVFIYRPHLRNQSNYLNLGLAVSGIELAFGFLIKNLTEMFVPISMGTYLYVFELQRCVFYQGLLWHCLALVGCAVEPLHYQTIVTTKKVTAFIIIAGIITGLFSLSPLLYPIEPQKYMNNANDTLVEQTGFENLTSGYFAFYWVCVLAFVVINITTIAIYSVILGILKKQLQKIHPHDQALHKSRSHYKGIIKLLFIMIYFLMYAGAGYVMLLIATDLFTELRMSNTYFVLIETFEVVLMTTCFINILFYGLLNQPVKNEIKSIFRK